MTADRDEVKYLLAPTAARQLAATVSARVPRHRFQGKTHELLPKAHQYVTTIYFDTSARDVAEACRSGDNSLKLRAKEYYDLHPSMAELATHPSQLVDFSPVLWLETKRRRGQRTMKHRFGIPKRELAAFFASGVVTEEMVRIQIGAFGGAAQDVLADLAELCRPYDGPLRADCLVNYRRRAWQDSGGTLRITLDNNLSFFAPPPDLWRRQQAMTRETLGPPAGTLSTCVLEVKTRGTLPGWLEASLAQLHAVTARLTTPSDAPFSKFLAGSDAIHAS
ncbi:MAG: VTC domain-containing protein [Planctomycetota bacterium]